MRGASRRAFPNGTLRQYDPGIRDKLGGTSSQSHNLVKTALHRIVPKIITKIMISCPHHTTGRQGFIPKEPLHGDSVWRRTRVQASGCSCASAYGRDLVSGRPCRPYFNFPPERTVSVCGTAPASLGIIQETRTTSQD